MDKPHKKSDVRKLAISSGLIKRTWCTIGNIFKTWVYRYKSIRQGKWKV